MLNILLAIVAWWLSLWDLRGEATWPMPTVLMFFAVACVLYVLARMVSAPIPAEGLVDLNRYHLEEGRKYAALFAAECALTIGTVFLYGSTSQNWVASNFATLPTMIASVAAACTNNRWVHSAAMTVIMLMWVWYLKPASFSNSRTASWCGVPTRSSISTLLGEPIQPLADANASAISFRPLSSP